MNVSRPVQLLLLRCRNKKQWAKDHFERRVNNNKSHDKYFSRAITNEDIEWFPPYRRKGFLKGKRKGNVGTCVVLAKGLILFVLLHLF